MKMIIVLEYGRGKLMQREIVDRILEIGAGDFSIPFYTYIPHPFGKYGGTLLNAESFCRWMLKECAIRRDSPFYLDEYLHAMVEEWYNREGNEEREGEEK